VREALATLPWVEQDSVSADVRSRKVVFNVTDAGQFDFGRLDEALKKQDFNDVELIHAPEKPAPAKKG
jgi:hypothetical protein